MIIVYLTQRHIKWSDCDTVELFVRGEIESSRGQWALVRDQHWLIELVRPNAFNWKFEIHKCCSLFVIHSHFCALALNEADPECILQLPATTKKRRWIELNAINTLQRLFIGANCMIRRTLRPRSFHYRLNNTPRATKRSRGCIESFREQQRISLLIRKNGNWINVLSIDWMSWLECRITENRVNWIWKEISQLILIAKSWRNLGRFSFRFRSVFVRRCWVKMTSECLIWMS